MQVTGQELIDIVRHGSASSASEDAIQLWVSHVLAVVLDRQWTWNRSRTYKKVLAPVSFTGTWNGTAGLPIIVSTAANGFTFAHTGRTCRIGERRYKVIGVNRSSNTLVFDCPLPATVQLAKLTLDRDEICVPASGIYNVEIVEGADKPLKLLKHGQKNLAVDSGTYYERIDPTRKKVDSYVHLRESISPPLFAPTVTPGSTGSQAQGVYYYAYSKIDVESGLDSGIGPVTKYVNTNGYAPTITYGASDQLELPSTYSMVLWRSDRTPNTAYPQMYAISLRTWDVPTSPYVDSLGETLHEYQRMWTGPQVTIKLVPAPQTAGLLDVLHTSSFHRRVDPRVVIEVGDKGVVAELCKLYADYQRRLSVGDENAHRSLINFNNQLKWYLDKDVESNDPSPADYERDPNPEVLRPNYSPPRFRVPM